MTSNLSLRSWALAAGAGAAVLMGGSAAAQQPASPVPAVVRLPQPEPRITLTQAPRSLGGTLHSIFKQTPYSYSIRATLGPHLFSVSAADQPLSEVLAEVLKQDPEEEALVWSFVPQPNNGGEVRIDREYIDMGPRDGENLVSLTNARLNKVLPRLFELMNVRGRIDPSVPPLLVDLQLRPNNWSQALSQVLMAVGEQEPNLTYSIDGDSYVVHVQKTPVSSGRRIEVAASNQPLRTVVAQILNGSNWKLQIAPSVRDVPISYHVQSEPELLALRRVLKLAAQAGEPVTYREGDGVLHLEPGPLPGEVATALRAEVARTKTATFNYRLLGLSSVLAGISGQTGAKIEMAPNIPNLPLTVKADQVGVEVALDMVIAALRESLPALSYRKTGEDAYRVEYSTK
ncbi:MAG: hypothetical protein ACK47B_22020 [Armatimonadota bacterium]